MTNPRPPRPFPAIDVRTIIRAAGTRRLVVIAPHPDDETLGCGSLIAAAVRAGVRVAVIALTDGQASHPRSRRWPPAALGQLRRGELRRALARLGAGRAAVHFMGWHDGNVAAEGCALALRRMLTTLDAGVVLAASPRDHHPDHQACWRLAVVATRGSGVLLADYAVWSRVAAGRQSRGPVAAKCWAALAHRSQVGGYIADDPAGFRLTAADLARFTGGAEVFTARRSAPRPTASAASRGR